MAEIPVVKKSGKGWLWVLLALILAALLAWWLLDNDGDDVVEYVDGADRAEAIGDEVGVVSEPNEIIGEQTLGADPVTPPEPVARESGISIADILARPTEFVGRNDFQDEVTVPEVPTDRGFWVEDQGKRLFALIIDNPREVPKDINSGQQLRITKGMIRDASFLPSLPGEPITSATRRIIENQKVFLVVDEENIQILSRG